MCLSKQIDLPMTDDPSLTPEEQSSGVGVGLPPCPRTCDVTGQEATTASVLPLAVPTYGGSAHGTSTGEVHSHDALADAEAQLERTRQMEHSHNALHMLRRAESGLPREQPTCCTQPTTPCYRPAAAAATARC